MRLKWSWLVGTVAVCWAACNGSELNQVGELNSGSGGDEAGDLAAGAGGVMPYAQVGGAGGRVPYSHGGTPPLVEAGSSGIIVEPPIGGAGAGGGGGDPCTSGNGCVYQEGVSIRGLTASETTLYWVEYGSKDDLGNYQHDGQLFARDFDSSFVDEIATDLDGPIEVGLTTTHLYVYFDKHWAGGWHSALARVPLGGGDVEVVMLDAKPLTYWDGPCPDLFCEQGPESFLGAGSTGYFTMPDGIYAIEAEQSEASLFVAEGVAPMAASDDSFFYYAPSSWAELRRMPRTGGDSEVISPDWFYAIDVLGDSLYSLEDGHGAAGAPGSQQTTYLSQMPASGGPWVHQREWDGSAGNRLMIVGGWFYQDGFDYDWHVTRGSIDGSEEPERLLRFTGKNPDSVVKDWVGTPVGVFWTDGKVIRWRE
jgi:hypothetical protein